MFEVADFGRGFAFHPDLEQLPVVWERGDNVLLHIDSTS